MPVCTPLPRPVAGLARLRGPASGPVITHDAHQR